MAERKWYRAREGQSSLTFLHELMGKLNHSSQPADNVQLLDASLGSWNDKARSACPDGPNVWLFLYGHFRTFHQTQSRHRAVLDHSTIWGEKVGPCSFTVITTPELPCEADFDEPQKCKGAKWGPAEGPVEPQLPPAGKNISTAALGELLREAQVASEGRLAFASLKREGKLADFPACIGLFQYALWAVSAAVMQEHGFPRRDNVVVIRTRPDVYMSQPFELGPLMTYFEQGRRGDRLVLLAEHEKTQTDMWMATSFGYFMRGIARPGFEQRLPRMDLGEYNGVWGWGGSGGHPADCKERARDDEPFFGCPGTAVETYTLKQQGGGILRLGQSGWGGVFPEWSYDPLDLARGARPYCNGKYSAEEAAAEALGWVGDRRWRHFWRGATPDSPVNLHDTDTRWPRGC